MVRVSILRITMFIAAVLSIVSVPSCEGRPSTPQVLDGGDSIEISDASLDKEYRDLQETSMAPTPVTSDEASSSSGFTTMTPTSVSTAAPTSVSTAAPTLALTDSPTDTSGVMRIMPAATSAVIAAMILVVTALTA